MKDLRLTVWSVWSWAVLGLLLGIWLPMLAVVRVVTAPFDRGHYWTGYLFRRLTVIHERLTPPWHFELGGLVPSDPRRPYVIVSNHESFVDILLIAHLPFEMKWLSKAELFKIPVGGWCMHLAGDIPLERGDSGSASKAMARCAEYLRLKVPVMIFPEGTRSASGDLLPFKDGAFRLAIETQTDLLPIAVAGTRTAMRKHSWKLGDSHAVLRVLEPVPVAGLTLDDLDELKAKVRDRIGDEVRAIRAILAAEAD